MDIGVVYSKAGGYFLTPASRILHSLKVIEALVFDWDGVFNNGMKTGDSGSQFSEIDSMGINLLRFSHWLKYGTMLHTFIITGMNNHTAIEFSQREHFDGIYLNCKNKTEVLKRICEKISITSEKIALLFDDVIDLGAAQMCGLSFCVDNRSDPLLTDFLKRRKIGNYITAFSGNDHAIREICGLLIGLNGNYDLVVDLRIKYEGEYREYLDRRNLADTDIAFL